MKKNILIFILLTLYLFGCEDIPDNVIDPKASSIQINQITAPPIFEYSFTDSTFITSVSVSSTDELKDVWMDIYTPLEEKMNTNPILLKDDGTSEFGDTQKDDMIYSAKILLGSESKSGTYKLFYYITDLNDNQIRVGEHNLKFKGIIDNNPPQIQNLEAPDSLKLTSQTQVLTLKINAIDPDGLSDLRRVFFNSFLPPEGRPSSSNPFSMYDDATHGDVNAGDGIYTLTIQMPPNTNKGTYRFEFQATDRLNFSSNIIIHQVVVY